MISAKSTKCITEVISFPIFSDGIYTIDTKIQFDSYSRKATVKNYNWQNSDKNIKAGKKIHV